MASSEQIQAYDRYNNAKTEGTKSSVSDQAVLVKTFVDYVNGFKAVDSSTIKVPLKFPSAGQTNFVKELGSTLFHVHWGQHIPPASGPGDNLMVQFTFNDAGDFTLTYSGFNGTKVYPFNAESLQNVTSRSIVLEAGKTSTLFRKTNQYINGAQVWNHQLLVNSNIAVNYYLVPVLL
jgi:hypothetical protein